MAIEEGTAEVGKKITLTICFSDNTEALTIKCKPTTPFSKIYDATAKHRGAVIGSFTLSYDAVRLNAADCPKMYEMEGEEQLDFHQMQIGGRSFVVRTTMASATV